MPKYKLILSEFGKKIYTGGNIPVLKKYLKTYDSINDVEKALREIGAGSRPLFQLKNLDTGKLESVI